MTLKVLLLVLSVWTTLFALPSFASALYTAKTAKYTAYSMKADRALQLNSGQLMVSNSSMPSTASAVWKLFVKACTPNVINDRYSKSLKVSNAGKFTILDFQCDNKTDFYEIPETVQFIITLDEHDLLADLQLLQFSTEISKPANVKTDDPTDILMEVGAGTLVQGLSVKDDQNSEIKSKIINSVAGSLVAVSTAALAYNQWNITKQQAYWIGVASSVVASILKGAYDSYSGETLDASDKISAAPGVIPSNIDIRFQISF
ncbi:hypothetical protein ACLVWU_01485 [Bdellovibrio sp. HCB290]|uniref:hypothetical protein n=1 Tax=Bdellovibrio sp. HCB290 TaxID=3394356 RepID=UPI0039B3B20A